VVVAARGWLSDEDYAHARALVPIACVDVLPWRQAGGVLEIGLITRAGEHGQPAFALVGGRVRREETLAAAVARHVAETLGPEAALGDVDAMRPLGVFEYFPDGRGGLVDTTKHAVAMTYAAPLSGRPRPAGEASAFDWFPADALPDASAFGYGHGEVVRRILPALTTRPGARLARP
jgi:ADP-ribose pyrophosphatase YjhB (NUDIX family)